MEADYYGIQYVYRLGMKTDCFLSAIQNVGRPDPSKLSLSALSPFPPPADRIKALQTEIDDFLPKRAGVLVSTPEFEELMQRLRNVASPEEPKPDEQPLLIRHDLTVSDRITFPLSLSQSQACHPARRFCREGRQSVFCDMAFRKDWKRHLVACPSGVGIQRTL